MDRVLALHAGSRGFDSHQGNMSEQFFWSNRPRYPHPVSSEREHSGIRVGVGDCSVTEGRRWRLPYQTGKTVHVHENTTNTTRTDARRRVCAAMVLYRWATWGTSLRELEYTHTQCHIVAWANGVNTSSQPTELSYMVILVHWMVRSIFTPLPVQVTLQCAGNQTPWQRSPVFKLSARDENSWIFKCFRSGRVGLYRVTSSRSTLFAL